MKFFSGRLYREALRQSRGIGILSICVSGIVAAFIPFFYYIQMRKDAGNYVQFIDVNSFVSGLSFISIAVPILLVAKLFSFLFKRSSSDFYHALPYTRECIYITHLLVALTWCLATLVACVSLPAIFYGINKHTDFKPEFILNNFVVGLIIMLFVLGALMIAVSVSGRMILSIELAAFIVFLPRVLILIALSAVESITWMIDINQIPFLSIKYNLPMLMTVGSAFDYSGYVAGFTYLPGILCSLGIAVLYLIIGCFLFCHRRSEVAENAVPNKKLQAVLRLVYSSIFFCLSVCMYVIYDWTEEVLIFAIIGLVIYFGYELITTRKLKMVIKAIPGLALVVVFCVAYGGIIKVSSNSILNNVPKAGDIESIEVMADNSYYWGEARDYNEILISEIEFEDIEINNIIAQSYSDMAEKVKADEFNPYDSEYMSSVFRINYKSGGSAVRVLYIDWEEYARLEAAFLKQPEYYEARYAIPEDAQLTEFSTEEYNENLWKQFVAEYSELSEREKDYVLGYESPNSDATDWVAYEYSHIYAYGYYESTRFEKSYLVIHELMPKTAALYQEYRYKENYAKLQDILTTIKDKNISSGDANLWIYDWVEFEDVYMSSLDIYVYYEDGEITGGGLNGAWGKVTKSESGDDVATDSDAEMEEDYYSSSSMYYELSAEEAETLLDMFLNAFDYENQADLNKTNYYVSMTYWDNEGFDGSYNDVNINLNAYEDKLEEMIEYLVENYN